MPVHHPPETGTKNHLPDADPGGDHHLYLAQTCENLLYIDGWKDYEMLELLKQGIDIGKVTKHWLEQFREDLDLKV